MQSMRSSRRPALEDLRAVFSRYPKVRAVYLFGSSATGRTHRESDLDLTVLPHNAGVRDSAGVRDRKLEMLTDLARAGFCDVDLVFLDTDDIVLKYEAVRQNRLVYATKDFDRGATYSLIVRQYLDFLPYLEVQRAAYKRRLLNDDG
jgi:hypothetical protein